MCVRLASRVSCDLSCVRCHCQCLNNKKNALKLKEELRAGGLCWALGGKRSDKCKAQIIKVKGSNPEIMTSQRQNALKGSKLQGLGLFFPEFKFENCLQESPDN